MDIALNLSTNTERIIYHLPVQTMVKSIDSLINQAVPIKSLGSINSSALTQQVIEAVVLSSTRLTQPGSAKGDGGFQITLAADKQQYQINSELPLPEGTKLLLKITQDNSAILLKILQQAPATTQATKPDTSPIINQQIKTIENNLRQALPSQQAIKLLLPVLQNTLEQISQQAPSRQTKALSQNIRQLLQIFPQAENLQQVKTLKQAVQNSGVFLEAKLAKTVQQTANMPNNTRLKTGSPPTTNTPSTGVNPTTKANNNALIKGDMKSQLQRLSRQIDKALQAPAINKPATNNSAAKIISTQSATTQSNDINKEAINVAPELQFKTATTIKQSNTGNPQKENLDVVLRQLGKQISASLARTQLNQLESLSNRAQFNPENQGANNSWVLEIPITQGKQIDNLELVISEEAASDEHDGKEKSWSVMLNFDLHVMGKMSVQLKIISQSVSAIIWSQLEHTHTLVSNQINELQENLEAIGVTVKTVDCYLGKPPEHLNTIHRQLVDVRT